MKNKNSLSSPKSSFKKKKRKPYVSARLVRHGNLRELTAEMGAAGLDAASETTMSASA